jgi:molybdopterin-binding protein
MNKLKGEITNVVTHDALSLVKVEAGGIMFSSIVIDTPSSNPALKAGNPVSILFKETEVIIARAPIPAISLQNRMECTIQGIRTGALLCELTLRLYNEKTAPSPVRSSGHPDEHAGEIRSVITRNACDQLDLRVNDKIIALVKTNEISLLTDD